VREGRYTPKDAPAQIRWFYRDRLDSGLAPATVHKRQVVLHKALKTAVAVGLIPRNAAAGLKLPRITREEISPLTEEESRRLLEAVRGDRLEALYVLALNTGMRQGELPALKAHLSRQLGEMEEMGSLNQPGGLILATEAETIINPSNLRNRSFKPLLKHAGLPQIRFHDLRHTCATLLLSKNVNPKIVSEMLS
jgi:integrase